MECKGVRGDASYEDDYFEDEDGSSIAVPEMSIIPTASSPLGATRGQEWQEEGQDYDDDDQFDDGRNEDRRKDPGDGALPEIPKPMLETKRHGPRRPSLDKSPTNNDRTYGHRKASRRAGREHSHNAAREIRRKHNLIVSRRCNQRPGVDVGEAMSRIRCLWKQRQEVRLALHDVLM